MTAKAAAGAEWIAAGSSPPPHPPIRSEAQPFHGERT